MKNPDNIAAIFQRDFSQNIIESTFTNSMLLQTKKWIRTFINIVKISIKLLDKMRVSTTNFRMSSLSYSKTSLQDGLILDGFG